MDCGGFEENQPVALISHQNGCDGTHILKNTLMNIDIDCFRWAFILSGYNKCSLSTAVQYLASVPVYLPCWAYSDAICSR